MLSPMPEGDGLPVRRTAHDAMLAALAGPPEAGGILAQDQQGRVTAFAFDAAAGYGKGAYRPTPAWVTALCQRWAAEGLRFAGFVHSHPAGYAGLSGKDVASARHFLRQNPWCPRLVMAIVCNARLHLFIVHPDGRVSPARLLDA